MNKTGTKRPIRSTILSPYQIHRESIGKHTYRQDTQRGNQKTHNEHIQRLASRPGYHKDNRNRQNTAHAMLQLLSILSAVGGSDANYTATSGRVRELNVYKNPNTPSSKPGFIAKTVVGGTSSTILNRTAGLLHDTGAFITRNDPLRFPTAYTLPMRENKIKNYDKNIQRQPRYVPLPTKSSTPSFRPDDVQVEKMFDFSCMNGGEDLSIAQIMRQIGKTLQQPITMMSKDLKDIASWNDGQGCAPLETINAISNITKKIDMITSQVLSLLPGSKRLAILQYIVGPLLERAANDLEGKPTPLNLELTLLQQINFEAKMSFNMMLDRDKMLLKNEPRPDQKNVQMALPELHLIDGKTQIKLEKKGKLQNFPIILNNRNKRIHAIAPLGSKGEIKSYQVYYNFMNKRWERTGNGKFNRFSTKERRLAQKLGLQIKNNYPSNFIDQGDIYSVLNPYFSEPERLNAIILFGHLVPCRYKPKIGKMVIYDAAEPNDDVHEIVLAEGEWHLKALPERNIKIETLYSPLHSRYLHVAVARKKNGREILAQYNPETGYFWGQKFLRDENNYLEPLPSKQAKTEIYKNKQQDESELIYDNENHCYRIKRGLFHGKLLCTADSNPIRPVSSGSSVHKSESDAAFARANNAQLLSQRIDHNADSLRTTRESGLYSTTETEYNDDIKIHSESGLTISVNEPLNEAWTLLSLNIKNANFNAANAVGSKIDVTFTISYKAKTGGKGFKDIPALEWNEIIDVKDGDAKWRFETDMYQHNPSSITFFPWRNRYLEAYHYSKADNKLSFNGSVKIYKNNREALQRNDIRTASSPMKMARNVRKYLFRNGGVMEITITDLPQILKRLSSNNKERMLEFNIGFNKRSMITLRQGISLSKDRAAVVFVTTSNDINVAKGEVNMQPPEIVSKARERILSEGEFL